MHSTKRFSIPISTQVHTVVCSLVPRLLFSLSLSTNQYNAVNYKPILLAHTHISGPAARLSMKLQFSFLVAISNTTSLFLSLLLSMQADYKTSNQVDLLPSTLTHAV